MSHTLEFNAQQAEPRTNWSLQTDLSLLDAARGGTGEAFAELYRRHRHLAHRVARRHAPRGEAEDVVSDAFTAIFRLVRQGTGPRDNLTGYLSTCIRHEATRRARNLNRCRPTDDERLLDQPDPRSALRSDSAERLYLAEVMAGLSERQRELLWAVEVEGRSPAELAADLEMSANSISAALYRARRALRLAYTQPDQTSRA